MHLPLRSSAGIWIALILGGALRFVGLGALPHPDELALLQSTARISWPELNPGWFDYPSFFLYQLAALDWLSLGDGTSLEARLLLFRAWTALLSVGGIAAAWALACRLGGPTAALFAAGLTASLDIIVLRSHYALTDIPAMALATVSLWLAVRGLRENELRDVVLSAALGGLAVSTKYSAASALVAAAICMIGIGVRRGWSPRRGLRWVGLLMVVSVVAFVIGTPHAILSMEQFASRLSYVAGMQAEGRGGLHMEAVEPAGLPLGATAYALVSAVELGPLVLLLAVLGIASLAGPPESSARAAHTDATTTRFAVAAMAASVASAYALLATSNAVERHYALFLYAPLIPLAGLGFALVTRIVRERLSPAVSIPVAGAMLLAALMPLVARSARTDAVLHRTDSRVLASDWLAHGPLANERVAVELYSGRVAAESSHREAFLADQPLTFYCRAGLRVLVISSLNEPRRTSPRDDRWYRRLREYSELLETFAGHELRHLDRFPGGAVIHHDPTIWVHRLRCDQLLDSLKRR